jgi:hypothetical protein
MTFAFRHPAMRAYLQNRFPVNLPEFASPLAHELHEQTRGMDFKEPEPSGRVSVGMFEHSFDEICQFVDWATVLWNRTLRVDFRSRRLATEELVFDTTIRDGSSARDWLLMLFESWNEFGDADEGPYLSLEKYPQPAFNEDPVATIGNVCAAFGLAVLDHCLYSLERLSKPAALTELGVAWNCATLARWLNHGEMGLHFNIAGESARMARAARARHNKDPKQKIKQEVRELWQLWEENRSSYLSTAAFARDMLDKWPNDLSSTVVVERWVRKWRREREQEAE